MQDIYIEVGFMTLCVREIKPYAPRGQQVLLSLSIKASFRYKDTNWDTKRLEYIHNPPN
jgi:hypothetical protein